MAKPQNQLRPIIAQWLHKLRFAWDYKKRTFGDDAVECMKFFRGPYDWLYGPSNSHNLGMTINYDDIPSPTWRMSSNRVAEMVQLFGPSLYQKNPHRSITPRVLVQPPMPPELQQAQQTLAQMQQDPGMMQQMMTNPQMAQQLMQAQQQLQMWQSMAQQDQSRDQNNQVRAQLLDAYLNYTPNELGLLFEIRNAIDEAIIKGCSCLWTQQYVQPTGMKMVGSFFDSVDNLLMDPDAEKPDDCWWIAQRCQHAVWDVEREYSLPEGTVKPNSESWDSQVQYDPDDMRRWKRSHGGTNDVVTYWKIYSRMGAGGRLRDADPGYREALDSYGDNCFLVIADGHDFLFNVPQLVIDSADDNEIKRRLQWPIPYWLNRSWPVELIKFHNVPRQIWPMSHLKPGLGELKFLNWAYSFLAAKMPTLGRNFLAMPKSLSEKNKTAIQSGRDLTILEMDAMHADLSKVLQGWTAGPIQGDFFKIIEMVSEQFERRVGLTPLLYGETNTQPRSAEDARNKAQQTQTRPEDMRTKVVESLSCLAQKEAIAAQVLLGPDDLTPILGSLGTYAWQQSLATCSINDIVHRLDFRVEADDTRVPNKDKKAQNMQTGVQTLFQPLLNLGQATQNWAPFNALVQDWAESIDLDASRYVFTPPPPPPPPQPPPPKVSVSLKGEDVAAFGLVPAILSDFLMHGEPPQQSQGPNPMIPASPPPAAPR